MTINRKLSTEWVRSNFNL